MSSSSNNKPVKRSAKAEDARFNTVIKSLEKEHRALSVPTSQATMFRLAGFAAVAVPLILFHNSVFDGRVLENWLLYGLTVFGAGSLLSVAYSTLATQSRRRLFISREVGSASNEKRTNELRNKIGNECMYFSLFAVNTLYMAFFMVFLAYSIPSALNDGGSSGVGGLISSLGSVLGYSADGGAAAAAGSGAAGEGNGGLVPLQFLFASMSAAGVVLVPVASNFLSRLA